MCRDHTLAKVQEQAARSEGWKAAAEQNCGQISPANLHNPADRPILARCRCETLLDENRAEHLLQASDLGKIQGRKVL